jgi:hypothetical protein
VIQNLPDWLSVPIGAATAIGSALVALWARSRGEQSVKVATPGEQHWETPSPSGPTTLLAAHNRELQRTLASPEFRVELQRNLVLEMALQVAIEEQLDSLRTMDDDQLEQFLVSIPEEKRRGLFGKLRDKLAGGAKDVAAKVLGLLNGFIKSQLGLGSD